MLLVRFTILVTHITSIYSKTLTMDTIFRDDLVIFTSHFNITKILVPAEGMSYVQKDFNDIPTIFFTISDRNLDGGSCIYVLQGLAAYEILESGRDSTCDYGSDKSVYFGAKDGVYKYNSDTLSARRFSSFRNDIIQIQKANGTDMLYYLTEQKNIYKLVNNGTVRSKINAIPCALEFVLDNENNIYYIDCTDRIPQVLFNGSLVKFNIKDNFNEVKLIRPAFVMDKSVPFFGDGNLYFLYANGTSEKKDVYIPEKAVYSVDAGLYLAAAMDGKIYEFNVMDFFLKSMFGVKPHWPNDLTKVVTSIVESIKDDIYKDNIIFQ